MVCFFTSILLFSFNPGNEIVIDWLSILDIYYLALIIHAKEVKLGITILNFNYRIKNKRFHGKVISCILSTQTKSLWCTSCYQCWDDEHIKMALCKFLMTKSMWHQIEHIHVYRHVIYSYKRRDNNPNYKINSTRNQDGINLNLNCDTCVVFGDRPVPILSNSWVGLSLVLSIWLKGCNNFTLINLSYSS